MDNSSSQLVSQVPFYTQLPYSHPRHTDGQSRTILDKGPRRTACHEEIIRNLHSTHSSTQNARRSQVHLGPQDNAGAEGNQVTSSILSVECQPIIPQEEACDTPSATQIKAHTDVDGATSSRPFPLVQWIKRIRQETPKQWPTFPLRWARTISAKQRAILDDDDAWVPPLPGRPSRPGTVPVDLLNTLSARADREHEKPTAQDELTPGYQLANLKKGLEPDVTPSDSFAHRTAALASALQAEEVADDAGSVAASEWSSSPPRPPRFELPPDTSPVADFAQIEQIHQQQDLETDTIVGETVLEGLATHPGEGPSVTSSQKVATTYQASLEREETHDDGMQCLASNINKNHGGSPKATVAYDRGRSNRSSEIHVEDTPYPTKIPNPRDALSTVSGPPQSSFVGATFPDPTFTQPDRDQAARSPRFSSQAERVSASHTPANTQGMMYVDNRGSSRSLKRSHNQQEDQDLTETFGVYTTISEDAADAGENSMQSANRQGRILQTNVHEGGDFDQPPTYKRLRIAEQRHNVTAPYIDPAYQDFDRRRNLERQLFRKSIAKSSRIIRTDEAFISNQNDDNDDHDGARSSSLPSSPPLSVYRSFEQGSNGPLTSVTNISMHESNTINASSSLEGPRHLNQSIEVNERVLSTIYNEYKAVYATYAGDLQSFTNAVRLLLKLHLQPREPHQSLWDDFIYRFADDYRSYLQHCLSNFENALPYQDYYHIFVKRSERKHEVVTRSVLEELQHNNVASENELYPSPRNRSTRLSANHIGSPTIAAHYSRRPDSQKSYHELSQPVMPQGRVIATLGQEIHNTPDHPSQASRKQQIESSVLRSSNKGRIKGRRSLPWDKANLVQSSPQTTSLNNERRHASGPVPETSAKVEKWLLSSRVAGAASPELQPARLPKRSQVVQTVEKEKSTPPINPQDLTISKQNVFRSIEPPSVIPADPIATVSTVESNFLRFTKNYACLQADRESARMLYKNRIPINMYDW